MRLLVLVLLKSGVNQRKRQRNQFAVRGSQFADDRKVVAMGPYVNFISMRQGGRYCHKRNYKGKVRHSRQERTSDGGILTANTHKEFHIGLTKRLHRFSDVNIFKYNGYKTIGANYIGDIGAHVAKCLWYIETYKKMI